MRFGNLGGLLRLFRLVRRMPAGGLGLRLGTIGRLSAYVWLLSLRGLSMRELSRLLLLISLHLSRMLFIGRGFGLLVRLLGSSGFFACGALSRLFAYGVGLSLHSYRSIRF